MPIHIRLLISIACAMFTTITFASKYKHEAIPLTSVTIPQLKGGFNIGISALFMTPSSSNLEYLDVNNLLAPSLINNNNRVYEVGPIYNWGFILDLGYVFPNSSHDVRFNWMAFHSNYSNEHTTAGREGSLINVRFFPLNSLDLFADTDYVDATGTINYKLDALDLTFGQYLNILDRLQSRVFAGLRYARFTDFMETSYVANWNTTSLPSSTGIFTSDINSSFNGLGPLIGTKTDIALGKGFGLSGTIDMALLAGQVGFSASQIVRTFTSDILSVNRNALNWGTQNVIAPVFDAKFGLNYFIQFDNGTQLVWELGYQVTQYFDVNQQMEPDQDSTPIRFDTDITNFGLRGPYLTLNVKI